MEGVLRTHGVFVRHPTLRLDGAVERVDNEFAVNAGLAGVILCTNTVGT